MDEMKKPHDRRVVKTKRAIRNAFMSLLASKDINDITVSDIAIAADINRKTFYNYYAGVYAVVDEIENEMISRLDGVLTEIDFTKNMNRPYMVFEKLTGVINTDPEFFGYLLSMKSNATLTNKLVSLLKTKTMEILKKYLKAEDRKLELMLDFMVPGMVAVYQKWYNSGRKEPAEVISSDINKLVFEGLKGYLSIDLGGR